MPAVTEITNQEVTVPTAETLILPKEVFLTNSEGESVLVDSIDLNQVKQVTSLDYNTPITQNGIQSISFPVATKSINFNVDVPTSGEYEQPIVTKVAMGNVDGSSLSTPVSLSNFTYVATSTVINVTPGNCLVNISYLGDNTYHVSVVAVSAQGSTVPQYVLPGYYYIFSYTSERNYTHFIGLLPDSDQERRLFTMWDVNANDNVSLSLSVLSYYTLFSLPSNG